MLFLRRKKLQFCKGNCVTNSSDRGDESCWVHPLWILAIGIVETLRFTFLYGVALIVLLNPDIHLASRLGCLGQTAIGKTPNCDELLDDDFFTGSSIFIVATFLAFLATPVFLILGTITKNRFYLLPWLIANWIYFCDRVILISFVIFNADLSRDYGINLINLLMLFLDIFLHAVSFYTVMKLFSHLTHQKNAAVNCCNAKLEHSVNYI